MFYHDRLTALVLARIAAFPAVLVAASMVSACGAATPKPPAPASATTAPGSASQPTTPSMAQRPAPSSEAPASPTASAIAQGNALVEQIRRAAGGPVLTALRSVEARGTSTVTRGTGSRQLTIKALYPNFYRQQEAPAKGAKGVNVTFGLLNDVGWMIGAMLGGDGRSTNADLQQRTYTRASRQAMGAFLAGVNLPWLIDSGKYTATAGGTIAAGPDRDLLILDIDGPDGRLGRVLVDAGTHLPRKLIQPPQPTGGAAANAETVITYSDFQPQAGLQLPRTIIKENGPVRIQWSIETYLINPKLPARVFSRRSR